MDTKRQFIDELLSRKVSRKRFLQICLSAIALLPFYGNLSSSSAFAEAGKGYNGRAKKGAKGLHDLVVAQGDDPYAITVKTIEAIGGMGRFVHKGDTVVVKPNIGWDRTPEQAANTNPEVVAALIDLAFKAGAKRVNVFDVTCNDPRRCYANSGIEEAARKHGAHVYIPDDWDTIEAHFLYESPMEGWRILRDAVACDAFINVPVLKHHGLTRLSLSMKNLMGVCGGNRGVMHRSIGQKLVDLTDFISPDLTVVDAYRVLVRNGPTGGDLDDVEMRKTVFASADPALADAYSAQFAGVALSDVPYLASAVTRRSGSIPLDKADILTVKA